MFCATNTQQNNVKTPHLHISIDKIGKYNKYLIYRVFYCFHFLLYDYIFRIENLYFVGFYVLLLFDIVINIQYNDLAAVTANQETATAYLQNSFFTAGYLMAASVVSLKCLSLVPDLAAWMVPEGETAFSARSFGEGVSSTMRIHAGRIIGV